MHSPETICRVYAELRAAGLSDKDSYFRAAVEDAREILDDMTSPKSLRDTARRVLAQHGDR